MKLAAIGLILFLPVLVLNPLYALSSELVLPAGDIYELRIHCGAGALYLVNAEWRSTIKVFAEIEAKELGQGDTELFVEKNINLSLVRQGHRAFLKSDLKPTFLRQVDARINLTIEVPRGIDVFIDDGSGPIHVQYFSGHLDIKDDSGWIIIENAVGNVRIADGSGNIILDNIVGNVEIKDGSGSIDVNQIKGDVRVTDGSGAISVQYVDGNVSLTDESGTIDINDISGNVLMRRSGTGELNIERVKGQVVIQN